MRDKDILTFNHVMKTKNFYQAPAVELMMTENESPLCASANPTDPFTGKLIGDEF